MIFDVICPNFGPHLRGTLRVGNMYILLTKREVKILAEFSFYVFKDRDEVEVHKNVKRERGKYPAILTELDWSIKDSLYGIKSTEKNDLRTSLFSSTEKETS